VIADRNRLAALALAVFALAANGEEPVRSSPAAPSPENPAALNSVSRISSQLTAPSAQPGETISIVREKALRETAETLGARAGLHDRSCELHEVLKGRTQDLDRQFRFASLMMGRGMLPPVISEARDSVLFEATVMRIASRAYSLDEPAMLVDVPPTWRNWMYVGLVIEGCGKPFVIPEVSYQLRPQNDKERAFFNQVLNASYKAGREQAQMVFDANLARLVRTYQGMRRYFELFERGMVSAPILISDTEVVSMDDPNTMLVGNTVIRITAGASFIQKPEQWKPLAK
jgi:hypothetical protein